MRNFVTQSDNFGLVGKSARRLLTTTALTAVGFLSIASAQAQDIPADTWSDHVADQGSIDIDTNIDNKVTDIQQNTDTVKVRGDGDIRADWTVNVNQLSSNSKYVLFDTEADATVILGKLNANGQVYIFDQNGVVFGEGSQVDVGSIVAAAGVAKYEDVISGKFDITDIDGDVANAGTISVAEGGLAALVGQQVSNAGVINAKMGKVILASGEKVTLDVTGGLFEVAFDDQADNRNYIENTGAINAQGGEVLVTVNAAKNAVDNVINMDGIVDVSSASVQGGKIVLSGGSQGKVSVSGTLDATGSTGGDIEVTGEYVAAENDAVIDASGTNGGGTIHFGGEYKGGGDTPTSKYAFVGQNAILRANADEEGDGGEVIVWSDEVTGFYGNIEAKGGTFGGNGGFVETSGKETLISRGSVDASAAYGLAGTWLLDPRNISIDEVAPDTEVTITAGDPTIIQATSGSNSNVDVDTIEDALDGGTSVTIRTNDDGGSGDGDITVNAEINKDAGGDATLRLEAHDDIIVNEGIIATIGSLTVELLAGFLGSEGGDHNVTIDADIETNGGNLLATGHNITQEANADIRTDGGNVTLTALENIKIDDDIRTSGGAATFTAGDTFEVDDSGDNVETEGGNIVVVANDYDLGGTLDAETGSVSISRNSQGDISLGDSVGGGNLSQNELDNITASELIIGDPSGNDDDVRVANADLRAFAKTTLNNTLGNAAGDEEVVFSGNNFFKELIVNSNDAIVFDEDARVDAEGNVTFNTDTNKEGTGDFNMGEDSELDTNGFDLTVNTLNVNLDEGVKIDAEGGNIVINNSEVFTSEDAGSVRTEGTGEVTINQNGGTAAGGTIQNAVDAIENTGTGRNTIFVSEGLWEESVEVSEDNFSLLGNNYNIWWGGARGPESIISPNSPGFLVTGDNTIVAGFTITGADNGVKVEGADSTSIRNNIIDGSTLNGIHIEDASGDNSMFGNLITNSTKNGVNVINTTDTTRIFGNRIKTARNGIRAQNVENIEIGVQGRNGIFDTTIGVFLRGTTAANIQNNKILDSRDGIVSRAKGNFLANNNEIEATDNGIEFGPFDADPSGAIIDITNNLITAGTDGVRFVDPVSSSSVYIYNNDVNADKHGISFMGLIDSSNITIQGNTVTHGHDGVHIAAGSIVGSILIGGGGIEEPDLGNSFTGGENGVWTTGTESSEISYNRIDDQSEDGVHQQKFGSTVVKRNTITNTGDDGVQLFVGNSADVYGNVIEGIGLNERVGDFAENDADGINAENIGLNSLFISAVPTDALGFGSVYGLSDLRIYDNAISIIKGDGIEATNSNNVYINSNLIGHTDNNGIKVDGFFTTEISDNAITAAGENGIVVRGREAAPEVCSIASEDVLIAHSTPRPESVYAGIFNNKILLARVDGINVSEVGNNLGDVGPIMQLGAPTYGEYGWNVNIDDNEVFMTGDEGIKAFENGSTRVANNEVFMTGLRSARSNGLGKVIDDINTFAAFSINPPAIPFDFAAAEQVVAETNPSFVWRWSDSDGINVDSDASTGPTGWAIDIYNNDVRYTGGDGISAQRSSNVIIHGNTVRYSGVKRTEHDGHKSMLDLLASGPFSPASHFGGGGSLNYSNVENYSNVQPYSSVDSDYPSWQDEEPSRRNLWIGQALQGVVGEHITPNDVTEFRDADGISVYKVHSTGDRSFPYAAVTSAVNGSIGYNPFIFDVVVEDNDVRITGDDGIEVVDAGRTLIEGNTVRDAGQGDKQYYGSGDFYGADGIHARDISAEIFSEGYALPIGLDGYNGDAPVKETYDYEPDSNYALIIRDNDVARTADDGIEVVGSENELDGKVFVTTESQGFIDGYHGGGSLGYFGTTDRVLIAENIVSEAGIIDDNYSDIKVQEQPLGELFNGYFGYGTGVGQDGYGHDGIHVRGIHGNVYEDITQKQTPGGAYNDENGGGFYGYAVDIIDNDVTRTADDGIEVYNSQSTLIYNNRVSNAGTGSVCTDCEEPNDVLYGGADYYGADGIHVRNIGGTGRFGYANTEGFEGIDPYSVVIAENTVSKTADDGVEVVGEFEGYGKYSFLNYNGTGRTLVLNNIISDAGTSGVHGNAYYEYSYDGDYDYDSFYFGAQGSYDGRGGDGISVYGVENGNDFNPWVITRSTEGGVYGGLNDGYSVKVIGNTVTDTGDDGIEVVNSGRTLIEGNTVRNSGLAGGINADLYINYYGSGGYNGYLNADANIYFGNAGRDGYGADGIHVRGVQTYNDGIVVWPVNSLAVAGNDGYGYTNYAVDIIGNDIENTADDGIDVRDSDSTFIYDNKVNNAGALTTSKELYASLNAYGSNSSLYGNLDIEVWQGQTDYTGGDGIHVENVGDDYYGDVVRPNSVDGGLVIDGDLEQYSVVIYGNNFENESGITNSADDGIEVLSSGRTRIEDNDVENSGLASVEGVSGYFGFDSYNGGYNGGGYFASAADTLSSDGYFGFYNGGLNFDYIERNGAMSRDGRGADGIHVGEVFATDVEPDPYFGNGSNIGNLVNPDINSVEIINNRVTNSADDGIQVLFSGNTQIDNNVVDNSGTGSFFNKGYFGGAGSSVAATSFLDGNDGYFSSDFSYFGGTGEVDQYGGDGIHVLNGYIHNRKDECGDRCGDRRVSTQDSIFSSYPYFLSTDVEITNNIVTNSADDGIEAEGVTNLLIDNNDVDESGDNGILAIGYAGFFESNDDEPTDDDDFIGEASITFGGGSPGELPTFEAIISNNTVTNSGTNNIESEEPDTFGGNGIQVDNYDLAEISGNTVENSFNRGIFSSGPFNGETQVFDNVLTDNDVHIEFQSGVADLTGAPGNTMNGGRVGLRFNPFEFGSEEFEPTASNEVYNWRYYPFYDLPEEGFSELTLVDNDGEGSTPFTGLNQVPTNFAGTIGAQTFNGQSEFFVEALGNFYETPFWLNGLDSTYVTPFGNITPADTNGVLSVEEFDFLNERFFDFRDLASVGIFFFGFVPAIDQEDIFNVFDPANLEEGGFSATVTGPISIPGAPADVANISPFAGGEGGEVTPESLNEIETAAGSGTQATCWSDALNSAGAGEISSISAGTSFEARVASANGCASGADSN